MIKAALAWIALGAGWFAFGFYMMTTIMTM